MSDSEHTTRGEDDLGRLALEVERLLAEGSTIDVDRLAAAFHVPVTDAQDVVDALDAFEDILFEPLQEVAGEGAEVIPPPTLPDDYELLGELGRGGMGIVYRAHQKSLGRDVAIKVLRPGELTFAKMLRRFEQEARSLARLKHPHIVSIHEVGKADGCVYFTMDLVEGKPLSVLIQERQITPTEAVRLLRQVTSAIAYTHGLGVIHRDLKPANILVDDEGRAFVVDFGLARDLAGPDELTRTGQVIGTANYMSPEQARGDKARIGEATDVYALGGVLYECLTGKPPFHGKGLAELMTAILHEAPDAPTKVDPRVPKALETICLKAMAKEPERRYATARAFLDDLERFEEGRTIRAKPPGFVDRVRAGWQRHWRIATVSVAAAIVAALSMFLVLLPHTGETVANLEETADNLARERQYDAAATVIERALALQGLRVPDSEDAEPAALPAPVRRQTLGLVHVWARYKARHVQGLYRREAYRDAMAASDEALAAMGRVERVTSQRNRSSSTLDVLWFGAAAAAHLDHASAPARLHRLYGATMRRDAPGGWQARILMGHGMGAAHLWRLRRELVPILADADHKLHPWVRRLMSALLATEAGREGMLSARFGRSRRTDLVEDPLDHLTAIVRGAVRYAYGRPLDDPVTPSSGAAEGRIDEAWFDVSNDRVVDIWRDLRNLLRRMAIADPERVLATLETLAKEPDPEEPLLARWALGLLAIGLDLPPWWDRDAPPPLLAPEVDAQVWALVEASRGSGAAFLAQRVEAGQRSVPGGDERARPTARWLRAHTNLPKPGEAEPGFLPQQLLQGLVGSGAPSPWHHVLVRTSDDRAGSLLWGEWCLPKQSSGLQAGEESLYRLWLSELVRRGTNVTRETAHITTRVVPFVDGQQAAWIPGLGSALLDWEDRPVGIGQLTPVYAGWTCLTAWPESRAGFVHRGGLAGLTYQPRRRLISEPGTGLAEVKSRWKIRVRPQGLSLEALAVGVEERSAAHATWMLVSSPPEGVGPDDVAVLRFERRLPPEVLLEPGNRAEPSQSCVLLVHLHPRPTEWFPGVGSWAVERLGDLLAVDPELASEEARAAFRRALQALLSIPTDTWIERLPAVIRGTWPRPRPSLDAATHLMLAAHGDPRGIEWVGRATDEALDGGLEALDVRTPLARCELWLRVMDLSSYVPMFQSDVRQRAKAVPACRAVALRRLNAVAEAHAAELASLVGVFAAIEPYTRQLEPFEPIRQAASVAADMRARRAPSAAETIGPYGILVLAIVSLGLLVLLILATARQEQRVGLGLRALAVGWLLAGQQLFVLPDLDLCVECLGLVLVWRGLVVLAPPSPRRELSAPVIAILGSFVATVLEKAGVETETVGRLAMALAGVALVLIPFWIDRLAPASRSRYRWLIPLLAMLVLVPTTFVATVQGPEIDIHGLGHGELRVWQDVPTGLLVTAYLVGCVLVFGSVVAYARRVRRRGSTPTVPP